MPSIPDIPGKGLVTGTTKRARVAAGAAGAGALAAGAFVAKRVLGHRNENGDSGAAPELQASPTSVAVAEKPAPKPKPAKPKAAPKPKADKLAPAKAEKPKPAKPKAAKPKVAKPKPAKAKAKAATEPGNRSHDKEPHHALNNPVGDPDETEYPDPFEKREDPRDPVDPDGKPFGEEPHPQVGSESTSEPPLSQDPEVGDRAKPPKRDKLDD